MVKVMGHIAKKVRESENGKKFGQRTGEGLRLLLAACLSF